MSAASCQLQRPVVASARMPGCDDYSWIACLDPAAVMARGECAHGHVREVPVCGFHQAALGAGMEIGCQQCFTAGRDCPMQIRIGERL